MTQAHMGYKGAGISVVAGENGFILKVTADSVEHSFHFEPGHANGLMRAARQLLNVHTEKANAMAAILDGDEDAANE
jgi:hypothetical protein